jgi:hypothetical protein
VTRLSDPAWFALTGWSWVNDEDVQAQILPPSGIAVFPHDPDHKLGPGCDDHHDCELVGEAEVLVGGLAGLSRTVEVSGLPLDLWNLRPPA